MHGATMRFIVQCRLYVHAATAFVLVCVHSNAYLLENVYFPLRIMTIGKRGGTDKDEMKCL